MRRPSLALLLVCGALFFGTVSVAPGIAGATSPRALYKALLASRFPQAQLPKGLHPTKPIALRLSSPATRHHVVGEVEVVFDTKGFSVIAYSVFPRRLDALGYFRDELRLPRAQGLTRNLPDFPQPAAITNVTLGGIRSTDIQFVTGNVRVDAGVMGRNGSRRADTLALARVALRHLKAVERRLGSAP
jgi:hypothetical protein